MPLNVRLCACLLLPLLLSGCGDKKKDEEAASADEGRPRTKMLTDRVKERAAKSAPKNALAKEAVPPDETPRPVAATPLKEEQMPAGAPPSAWAYFQAVRAKCRSHLEHADAMDLANKTLLAAIEHHGSLRLELSKQPDSLQLAIAVGQYQRELEALMEVVRDEHYKALGSAGGDRTALAEAEKNLEAALERKFTEAVPCYTALQDELRAKLVLKRQTLAREDADKLHKAAEEKALQAFNQDGGLPRSAGGLAVRNYGIDLLDLQNDYTLEVMVDKVAKEKDPAAPQKAPALRQKLEDELTRDLGDVMGL